MEPGSRKREQRVIRLPAARFVPSRPISLWALRIFLPVVLATAGAAVAAAAGAALWRFDAGTGRVAVCRGVPDADARMLAQWARGKFGTAVYFSEAPAATVVIADGPALHFGCRSFTISAWICPTKLALKSGAYRRLLCKSSFPGTFWTLDIFTDGRVMFAMRDDQGHTGTTRTTRRVSEKSWTHLAVVVDRENFVTRYFFNGEPAETRAFPRTFTGALDVPGRDLLISTWRKYVGLVDNLRIAPGAADAKMLQSLYESEKKRYRDTTFTTSPLEKIILRVAPPTAKQQTMWDMARLSRPPAVYPAPPELENKTPDGIRALFFEGEPYEGHPTRIFAWCGVPPGRQQPGPAMVLVHGGGGTAFRSWVRLWVDRGFAAIAMDTCGAIPIRPGGGKSGWKRHAFSGPNGWGDFAAVDKPVHDQWTYHAVAAVVRAHSLLRSLPAVDPDRVGLTGISWGGYLAEIVAGVDDRFAFVSPVYGCGFLGENSAWTGVLGGLGEKRGKRWLRLWDPSQYIVYARMPMLFCAGTNDHFYPLDSWRKTCRAARGPVTLCCKVRMPHGHPPAGDPPEITAFARAILAHGVPLLRVTASGAKQQTAWVEWSGDRILDRAVLEVTCDRGLWEKRNWESLPATVDRDRQRGNATLPAGATAWFFNLIDAEGLTVSSEYRSVER